MPDAEWDLETVPHWRAWGRALLTPWNIIRLRDEEIIIWAHRHVDGVTVLRIHVKET